MLQDPNTERLITNAIRPLRNKITRLEREVADLKNKLKKELDKGEYFDPWKGNTKKWNVIPLTVGGNVIPLTVGNENVIPLTVGGEEVPVSDDMLKGFAIAFDDKRFWLNDNGRREWLHINPDTKEVDMSAQRAYYWVDRILILDNNRKVLSDIKYSVFKLGLDADTTSGWNPVMPDITTNSNL